MLSKANINRYVLICCKCEKSNPKLFQLSCYHFLCLECIQSLKIKIFYHCKKWKIFLKNEINSQAILHKSSKMFIKAQYLQKRDFFSFLDIFLLNFLDKILSHNTIDLNLIVNYFNCSICNRRPNKPIAFSCRHIFCENCSSDTNECSICEIKYEDLEVGKIVTEVYYNIVNYVNKRTQDLINELEDFFVRFEDNLIEKRSLIEQEIFIDRTVYSINEESKLIDAKISINSLRSELIERLNNDMESKLRLLDSSNKILFRASKDSVSTIQILGHFKNDISIPKRIKYLHLIQKHNFVDLKLATEKSIINWTPSCKNSDLFTPIYLNRLFFVYFSSSVNKYDFQTSIRNYFNSSCFNTYSLCIRHKLEYFKIDLQNDRVAFLFEIKYEKEYVLKIYSLYGMKFICSKNFNNYLDNILFDEKNVVTWCSNYLPCLKIFDEFLNELDSESESLLNEKITDEYYSLSDLDANYLYLNNQCEIVKVCRKTGSLVNKIKIEDDFDTQSGFHAKMEYLNIKLFDQFLIVTTLSKIFIFDKNKFSLIIKNDIFCIPNNDWIVPNRLYKTKDKFLAFFDQNFVTFI